jgi:multidrug resistance efflux pump
MRKGVTGKIIVTVVTLILAILALAVLWMIYREKIFGALADVLERSVGGLIDVICKEVLFC